MAHMHQALRTRLAYIIDYVDSRLLDKIVPDGTPFQGLIQFFMQASQLLE
jgi:hypothetical protein